MTSILGFRQEFADRYGSEPRIFRAPARVNLIGEHTDYNGGFVLPFAIERAIYVAAAPRKDAKIRVASQAFPDVLELVLETIEATPMPMGWMRYPFGVISLVSGAEYKLGGADLLITSDIPTGAGLSSSAALEVGIATALNRLFDLNLSEIAIAKVGQRTENEFAGVNSGIMDQMASVLGRSGYALHLDCSSLEWQHVPIGKATFFVCDTRTKHSLAEGAYNTRRRECEEAAASLTRSSLRDAGLEEIDGLPTPLKERARHVITENGRVASTIQALTAGNFELVGELMNASHASLRDDFQVSCDELDNMAELCRTRPEVLGSRMMGGGFGGCVINICKEGSDLDRIAAEITAEYSRTTGITPVVFSCSPTNGASEIMQANYEPFDDSTA